MQRQQQRAVLDCSPSPELKRLERSQQRVQAFFPDMRQVRSRTLVGLQKQTKAQQAPQQVPASPQSTKRLKRKLNRKKRRKRMQALKQGINQLKGIFEKIYYMGCTFEELRQDIILAVQKIPSEGEFVDRLNQLIRDYVEDTCDYLLEERNRFATSEGKAELTKAARNEMRPLDQHSLQVEFISVVYEQFYVIKTSSQEIDKMIELYYQQSKGNNPGEILLKEGKCPLYKSTFIYMMNHEIKLKNWLTETSKMFHEADPQDQQSLAKLQEMLSILYEYTSETETPDEFEVSTADSDEKCLELQHYKPKKKHIHSTKYADEGDHYYISEQVLCQQLMNDLQRVELKGPRLKCEFDSEWLLKFEAAFTKK